MPFMPKLPQQVHSLQKKGAVISVEIIVDEKQKVMFPQGKNFAPNSGQTVFSITASFPSERTKRTAEIAVPAGLHLGDPANPVGQIEPRRHFLGHVRGSECFSNDLT